MKKILTVILISVVVFGCQTLKARRPAGGLDPIVFDGQARRVQAAEPRIEASGTYFNTSLFMADGAFYLVKTAANLDPSQGLDANHAFTYQDLVKGGKPETFIPARGAGTLDGYGFFERHYAEFMPNVPPWCLIKGDGQNWSVKILKGFSPDDFNPGKIVPFDVDIHLGLLSFARLRNVQITSAATLGNGRYLLVGNATESVPVASTAAMIATGKYLEYKRYFTIETDGQTHAKPTYFPFGLNKSVKKLPSIFPLGDGAAVGVYVERDREVFNEDDRGILRCARYADGEWRDAVELIDLGGTGSIGKIRFAFGSDELLCAVMFEDDRVLGRENLFLFPLGDRPISEIGKGGRYLPGVVDFETLCVGGRPAVVWRSNEGAFFLKVFDGSAPVQLVGAEGRLIHAAGAPGDGVYVFTGGNRELSGKISGYKFPLAK